MSGVVAGPVLKGQNELKLSRTFDLGKSVLNDAEVMNASHWGVYRVHVKGGKIERLEPVEFDKAPSLQLQALAVQRRSHPLPDGSQELSGKGL